MEICPHQPAGMMYCSPQGEHDQSGVDVHPEQHVTLYKVTDNKPKNNGLCIQRLLLNPCSFLYRFTLRGVRPNVHKRHKLDSQVLYLVP